MCAVFVFYASTAAHQLQIRPTDTTRDVRARRPLSADRTAIEQLRPSITNRPAQTKYRSDDFYARSGFMTCEWAVQWAVREREAMVSSA